jgi:hypothetical protein
LSGRRANGASRSPAAFTLLQKLYERRSGELIFGLSTNAIEDVIKDMNADRAKKGLPLYVDPEQNNRPVTPHGTARSTFRDWAGDVTIYDKDGEVVEFCLAHGITDKTEAAYRRSTAVAKRANLMAMWCDYCAGMPEAQFRVKWANYIAEKSVAEVIELRA